MALQNLRSSTPSKRPDASSMSDGQIALNTAAASAGLFFKDSSGNLVKTGPVHVGTTAPNSTPATGGSTGNSKGEAWLDTSNNNYVLKIYDGTAFRSVEIAPGSARQLLQTNAAGTDVEFTSNVDVPGTLDVTGVATFDANVTVSGNLTVNQVSNLTAGTESAPALVFDSDLNSGIYHPAADQIAISTAGVERLRVSVNGNVGIGSNNPQEYDTTANDLVIGEAGAGDRGLTIASGTGSRGTLMFADGVSGLGEFAGYLQYNHSGNYLAIATNNSEAMRITSTGSVGVGTSSPNAPLEVQTASGERILFDSAGASQQPRIQLLRDSGADYSIQNSLGIYEVLKNTDDIYRYASDIHQFHTAGSGQRMCIDSSGQVGIGTSSPIAQLNTLGINSGGQGGTMCIQNTGSGADTNVALFLTPNNGGGNDLQRSAIIKSRQDTAGNFANLEFYTSASATPTERMRITSSGHVLIHQTSSSTPGFNNTTTGTSFEKVEGTALFISRENQATLFCNRNGDGNLMRFFRSGSQVGRVDVSSTNATFVTTSDYRLKENVTSLSDGIDRLKLLTPRRFNFIAAPGETIDGFIAHELSDAVPEAVFGEKDAMEEQEVEVTPAVLDDEGNVTTEAVTEKKSVISPQGIDQGKLMPLLTAALQEAVAKIETLETKVAALEAE